MLKKRIFYIFIPIFLLLFIFGLIIYSSPFVVITPVKALNFVKEDTGIIFFTSEDCPWCKIATPVLKDVLKEYPFSKAYILDVSDIRNDFSKGQNGSYEYNELLEILNSVLPSYTDENGEPIADNKRIYMPGLLVVKDGEVLGYHNGTLDSQEKPEELTKEQYSELYNIYKNLIKMAN